MISTIRKNFSKQAFNIVIWITILSLGGGIFIGGLFRRFMRTGDTGVSFVDGYEISIREFQRKVGQEQRRESYMRQQFGANASAFLEALGFGGKPEDRALKALTEQKLLLACADKLGLRLSPDYVSNQLENPYFALQIMGDMIPAGAVSPQGVNYRDLLKLLQRQGVSARCLEEVVEERIKGQLVLQFAQGAAYVPIARVRDEFDRAYRAKKLSLIKVPIADYLAQAKKVSLDTAALEKFFQEANQRNHHYWSLEKRSGSVWTFDHIPDDFLAEGEQVLVSGFDEFVKKYQGAASPLGPVALPEESQGAPDNVLTRKLFSLKDIGERAIFVTGEGKERRGFVVELTKVDPRAEQPLSTIRGPVEQDYYLAQAAQALANDLTTIKGLDASGRQAWINEHKALGATSFDTDFIEPDKKDSPVWASLEKEGLQRQQVSQLLSLPVGQSKTVLTPQAGYVIGVKELAELDIEKFNQKKPELFNTLMRKEGEQVAQGFIASLEKNAKIKTNKSFIGRR